MREMSLPGCDISDNHILISRGDGDGDGKGMETQGNTAGLGQEQVKSARPARVRVPCLARRVRDAKREAEFLGEVAGRSERLGERGRPRDLWCTGYRVLWYCVFVHDPSRQSEQTERCNKVGGASGRGDRTCKCSEGPHERYSSLDTQDRDHMA